MDRVRGPHVTAVKPAYDDPLDPLTEDTGFFPKDPGQAPAQWTVDHAQLITEELCNLVEGLGFTLKSNDDTQLTSAIGPALMGVRLTRPTPDGVNSVGFTVNDELGVTATTAGAVFYVPITLPAGARVRRIGGHGTETNTLDVSPASLALVRYRGPVREAITTLTGWPESYGDLESAAFLHEVEAGYSYLFELVTPNDWDGTSFSIQAAYVTVDLAGKP